MTKDNDTFVPTAAVFKNIGQLTLDASKNASEKIKSTITTVLYKNPKQQATKRKKIQRVFIADEDS